MTPFPTAPPTRLLPAALAVLLHLGGLWLLVRALEGVGTSTPRPAPTVHLLSSTPMAGGGNGTPRLTLSPTPAAPSLQPPPPVEVPTVTPTTVAEVPTAPAGAMPGVGQGPGQGEGAGAGAGLGAGSGRAAPGDSVPPDRSAPPAPRQEVLPPLDYPRTLRGRGVDVTFWIGLDGRVERVQVTPSFDDSGFQRTFLDAMRRYRFRPARGPDGTAVPGTLTLTITF